MHTVEKRAAARNAFGREADSLVGAPGATVVGEQADAKSMGIGLDENPVDHGGQQHPAMALSRRDDSDALDQCHALGRSPLAKDGKAYPHRTVDADKIGMAAVDDGFAVTRFVPTPDKGVIALPRSVAMMKGRSVSVARSS
jgi:hypothetical protein